MNLQSYSWNILLKFSDPKQMIEKTEWSENNSATDIAIETDNNVYSKNLSTNSNIYHQDVNQKDQTTFIVSHDKNWNNLHNQLHELIKQMFRKR